MTSSLQTQNSYQLVCGLGNDDQYYGNQQSFKTFSFADLHYLLGFYCRVHPSVFSVAPASLSKAGVFVDDNMTQANKPDFRAILKYRMLALKGRSVFLGQRHTIR